MADATGYHVHPNPKEDKVDLVLLESVDHVSRLQLNPKDTSVLAGYLLDASVQIFEQSGKPPPYTTKDQPVTFTDVRCSGYNIGPGRRAGQLRLLFHFGETTLAIPLAHSDAQSLSQRLMAASAHEDQSRRQ